MKKTLIEALVDLVSAYKNEPKTYGSVATDKGTLQWDGEEYLKAGDKVYALDADGNRVDVADGDYTTEDGKVISVEGNEVKEIRDKEAQVAPEDKKNEGEQKTEEFRKVVAKFSASYSDKIRAISEALASIISGDYYIVEAGDDYCVAEKWNSQTYQSSYKRYAVAWDGNKAVVSGGIDVKPAYVPVDADYKKLYETAEAPAEGNGKDAKIAELEAKIKEQEDALAAKDAEIAEKDAKIAELEAKIAESPAGEDAHAAYRKQAGSLDKTDENFVDLYKRLKR